MDIAINQIDFNVAVSALQDQVLARLEQVNVLEIEFLRQFECHHTSPQTHPSLVYSIRKILTTFEDVYEGVKGYFVDLKMEITYQLFRKIQLFMVNGYNFLARALLAHIDSSQEKKNVQQNLKSRQALLMKHKQQKLKLNQRGHSKKLEHCDYAIGFFESQQAKITEQMHRVQQSLLNSKQLVQKLIPSKAVKQLTQIKEQAEVTLQNTQKIFQQTYQLKYLQFKNYLSQMLKPQDITNEFCQNVKTAMHDKFTSGVKRSVNTIQQIIREEEQMLMREIAVQTEDVEIVKTEKKTNVSKNTEKMQNLLLKERRANEKLTLSLELLKKEIQLCRSEKERIVNELIQTRKELVQKEENYDILTKLYEQRREELVHLQTALGTQNKIINDLRIFEIRFKNKESKDIQVNIQCQKANKEIQVRLEDEQELLAAMRKRMEKFRSRIMELELKEEREAKALVRKINRRQSKKSESVEEKEVSVERRSVRRQTRKRTQTKKKTIIGNIAINQRSDSNSSMIYQKKLSSMSGNLKLEVQSSIKEGNKKRHASSRLSKFNETKIKSLKSISENEAVSNNNEANESRECAVQTEIYNEIEAEFACCQREEAFKTDKSIQAEPDTNIEEQAKTILKYNTRLSQQSKANSTTRQKNNDLKNSHELSVFASKENRNLNSLGLMPKKDRNWFSRTEQGNFKQMEVQKLRNTANNKKQHFEILKIKNQQKNGLVKRNIMEKTTRYLLSNKSKHNQIKDTRNLTCEESSLDNEPVQDRKSHQKRECLINIDRITLQRSFDIDPSKLKKIQSALQTTTQ